MPIANRPTIVPPQVRATRGLLGWGREKLAAESGISRRSLERVENEEGSQRRATVEAIRATLEAAGVEFITGDAPGVRLRNVRIWKEG
jgi:transcriptional regulator with XRE-family HTH domain